MFLQYGSIVLQIVDFQEYHREPIWDGPTYLYTRHRLRVRCIYNPAATAYFLAPGNVFPPVAAGAAQGVRAPVTDVAVRHFLLQPRLQLTVGIGVGQVFGPGGVPFLLQSPRTFSNPAGAAVPGAADANNGPVPLACDVVRVSGTKTFIVDFSIQTDVNECFNTPSTVPSILLSHRWQMAGETSRDGYTTRVIKGRAVFNTERMFTPAGPAIPRLPDNFRAFLFHPLPVNFHRDQCDVAAVEDGTSLEYTLVDRETPLNLQVQGVTHIEATMTAEATGVRFEEIARRQLLASISLAAAAGLTAATFGLDEPFLGPTIAQGITAFAGAVLEALPTSTLTVTAKVWGNRTMFRSQLRNVATTLILDRLARALSNDLLAASLGTGQFAVMEDLAGTYAEARATFTTGLSAVGFRRIVVSGPDLPQNVPINMPDVNQFFPDKDDDTSDILLSDTWSEAVNNLPSANMSRGTYIGQIAAQALMAPCQTSGHPADPPLVGGAGPSSPRLDVPP